MARRGGGGGGGGGGGEEEGELPVWAWIVIGLLIAGVVIWCISACYKKTCANPPAAQNSQTAANGQVHVVAAPGTQAHKPAAAASTTYPVMTQQQTYTPASNTYQQTAAYTPMSPSTTYPQMTPAPGVASPYTPASSYTPTSSYAPASPYPPSTPAPYQASTGYPPMPSQQAAFAAPPTPAGGFVAQYPPQPQQPGQYGASYV
ncbi:hypothetical protein EC991_011114 [Linnemannia zychae]|nr:hypothetical protein EC991_011114 [Linnemannia zychae]